ncbi:50S ribosomal protein L1 [Buchnera aphidicola (Chaitoregma tattakana)]|uniref:50S ribosomal protein L1 n=1 Tax=Buchnera aphidicola TaxID=9 RepID=UPI0031B827D0
MKINSKRMRKITNIIKKKKIYNIEECITTLKKLSVLKFTESIDVAINLNINTKKSEQNIRNTVLLPNKLEKKNKILVFTKGKNIDLAKKAKADYIYQEGTKNIKKEIKKFNIVIASPDSMNIVGKLGHILGPRGLMPNIKFGTLTNNIYNAIIKIKEGQIKYKSDKSGIIHASIGKVNFTRKQIKENFLAFMKSLKQSKPTKIKGEFFKKIYFSTTMGGSIQINHSDLNI